MQKHTVVIYHAKCPDGFGAAFTAWLKFGDAAEYVPANYSDAPPDVTGKDVYILDFSYKKDVLAKMDTVAKSITLLDHHKTAKEGLAGFQCRCGQIHIDTSKSGARLAWEHFNPGKPVPALLSYIEERDLWRFALPNTNEFLAYLDMLPFDFKAWRFLLDEGSAEFAQAMEVGTLLHKRYMRICDNLAADAVPVKVAGYEGLMVSCSADLASTVGSLLAAKTGTFGLVWRLEQEGRVKVSLRAVKPFDVEAIAARFPGGGGHPQSAGFHLPLQRAQELIDGELNYKPPGFWKKLLRLLRHTLKK
jgi:oligoribonuclease NrnB/cAMP/cGMP phosphodiesterase (DHH superfamily)